jgi:hypothetical protein
LRGVDGCELCADERPETIAAALERVLRRRQRAAGRDAVKELDETLLTSRVIAIYQSVITGKRRRGQHANDECAREIRDVVA